MYLWWLLLSRLIGDYNIVELPIARAIWQRTYIYPRTPPSKYIKASRALRHHPPHWKCAKGSVIPLTIAKPPVSAAYHTPLHFNLSADDLFVRPYIHEALIVTHICIFLSLSLSFSLQKKKKRWKIDETSRRHWRSVLIMTVRVYIINACAPQRATCWVANRKRERETRSLWYIKGEKYYFCLCGYKGFLNKRFLSLSDVCVWHMQRVLAKRKRANLRWKIHILHI